MDIAEKFIAIRKALHMNQNEFARPLGIGDKHISAIENKRTEASTSVMELMFIKHLVNRVWWETGEGNMFLPTPVTGALLSSEVPDTARFTGTAATNSQEDNDDIILDDLERIMVREARKRGRAYEAEFVAKMLAEEEAGRKKNPAA